MKPSTKDEFKRPLSKSQVHPMPLLALPSAMPGGTSTPPAMSPRKNTLPAPTSPQRMSPRTAEKSRSVPEGLRSSLSKSEAPRKGTGSGKKGSPMGKKAVLSGMSVYSPRWIVSVKRETDKQVKAFLESLTLPAVRENVSPQVLGELERQGEVFLALRTEMLGPKAKAMVVALQQLLAAAGSPKEKKLVVQLLLAISSCSRLDEYIECVREAEKGAGALASAAAASAPTRAGYDGQMEYAHKTESPRLRDSASKRANFLSVSLNGDDMEAFIQLIPSPPPRGRSGSTSMRGSSGNTAAGSPQLSGEGAAAMAAAGEGSSDALLCRVCETMIGRSIYEEHSKFCKKKLGHDIEVLTVDQAIGKLLPSLKAGSPLRLLMERVAGISAQQGGFCEGNILRKQLERMVADRATGYPPDAPEVARCLELIARKTKSLQNAEIAVLQSPRLPSPSQSRTPVLERHSTSAKIPSILDFEIIKPIARGGYGGVYLARKRATRDLYAIKAINRKEMIRRGEMKSIFAERNILASVHSDHVVKMFFAMASKKYLFFVMEFMSGGDLFSLLRKFGRLEEQTAKFYVAEVVLALEDLHKQGVVHRDLPDNILIGGDGHVKLADFGLSAMGLINKQARDGVEESNVVAPAAGVRGTPHYLAPEVLLGLPHTQAVDWWALGVLLFEFVNGYPPFDGDTVQEVFSEIFAGSINWPANDEMSEPCKDLIKRLLENDPQKRLHDAIKVKAHPFFTKDDPEFWLTLGQYEPPYVPMQTSEDDTSAFDERGEAFPMSGDTHVGDDDERGDGDSDSSEGSSSSDEEEEPSADETASKPKKDSSGILNFWHVSVQNLGALNKK